MTPDTTKCDYCDERFSNVLLYMSHMSKEHGVKFIVKDQDVKS